MPCTDCDRPRFKGALKIGEVGLTYMRNRFYSSSLGRFISEDPIGLEGGINQYAYAGNDPVNNSDPTGMMCWTEYDPDLRADKYVCDMKGGGSDLINIATYLGGMSGFGAWLALSSIQEGVGSSSCPTVNLNGAVVCNGQLMTFLCDASASIGLTFVAPGWWGGYRDENDPQWINCVGRGDCDDNSLHWTGSALDFAAAEYNGRARILAYLIDDYIMGSALYVNSLIEIGWYAGDGGHVHVGWGRTGRWGVRTGGPWGRP
jgi:RHS repeat-associated protein